MFAMQTILQKMNRPHDIPTLIAEMVTHEMISETLGMDQLQEFEENLSPSSGTA